MFDLRTEKMTTAAWRLPLRRDFSATEYKKQIVLVGGGSRVTLLDPVSGFGRELAPLPFAAAQASIALLGDELLMFGGDVAGRAHAGIYALSFTTNTWRHTGRFLTEAKGLSQVVPMDGGVAILGGERSLGTEEAPVATFEMFRKMK